MPEVLGAFPFKQLEDLCCDIEGTLAVIINGKYSDKKFVIKRVNEITKKYEHLFDSTPFGLSTAMDVILEAFVQFEHLKDDVDDPEWLEQQALEIFTSLNGEVGDYLNSDIEQFEEIRLAEEAKNG